MSDESKLIDTNYNYQSTMTRRQTIKWFGLLVTSAVLPNIGGCETKELSANNSANYKGHWPSVNVDPVNAIGYGKDPNLIIPPESLWPRTLTNQELTLVAVLSDIIVPREGQIPSASEVKVPEVVDEWVSAPYEPQMNDRITILSALKWIDDESRIRYSKVFIALSSHEQISIIDDIAFHRKPDLAVEFVRISEAFHRLRQLVLAAFFCSPIGTKDLGYIGNVPIAGDYPGPTPEAFEHLDNTLKKLGLST